MNRKIRNNRLVTIFLVFLCAAVIFSAAYILTAPDDLAALSPDNTSGNMLSGGKFAYGDDIFFYLEGDKLYSVFGSQKTLLKSGVSAPLFYTDGAVIYSQDNTLYQMLTDGSVETMLLENVRNPLIIGRWIYYIADDGQLVKQRIDDGRKSELGIYPVGKYYVSATSIYYIADDGFLYTAKTDGSQNALVCAYKMTDFIVGGNYIFYRNEGSVLCWFPVATPEAKAEHIAVSSYNYVDGYAVYRNNNEIFAVSLTDMTVLDIASDAGTDAKLYCDDNYVYYYNDQSVLTRVAPDGSESTTY